MTKLKIDPAAWRTTHRHRLSLYTGVGDLPTLPALLGTLLAWCAGMSANVDFEEGNRVTKPLGLAGKFFRSGSHLFRGTGILLDNLIELLDSFINLLGTGILLFTGGGYLLD